MRATLSALRQAHTPDALTHDNVARLQTRGVFIVAQRCSEFAPPLMCVSAPHQHIDRVGVDREGGVKISERGLVIRELECDETTSGEKEIVLRG